METFRPGGLKLTQKAAEAIGLREGQRVLDVGCGNGATLGFLISRYGVQGYGIDLSEDAAARARGALPHAEIRAADGCALPYPDEAFDAVFMECTLTEMREPETALREAIRVLKQGGSLVVGGLYGIESAEEGMAALCSRGRIVEHRLKELLAAAGFQSLLWEDQSQALVQFVADVIFQYGSLGAYIASARDKLGGCVLSCAVPVKGTGYLLAAAQKNGALP